MANGPDTSPETETVPGIAWHLLRHLLRQHLCAAPPRAPGADSRMAPLLDMLGDGRVNRMTLALDAEPLPLRTDRDGTIRIGQTRVPLETVVHAFNEGAAAEEIAYRYPTLELADIYATITYYLRHPAAVDEYLAAQEARTEELRQKIEARQPVRGSLRARLLAQRGA